MDRGPGTGTGAGGRGPGPSARARARTWNLETRCPGARPRVPVGRVPVGLDYLVPGARDPEPGWFPCFRARGGCMTPTSMWAKSVRSVIKVRLLP
jgi:hypothetical protein